MYVMLLIQVLCGIERKDNHPGIAYMPLDYKLIVIVVNSTPRRRRARKHFSCISAVFIFQIKNISVINNLLLRQGIKHINLQVFLYNFSI